ncbi:hypothetical protein GCK72_002150 [Caenorhabditis remanei]|uniref:F-box domain-containing protein n=2 Tax=Caenorhabditis remanei TaxID=31234 RepID=E3LLY8_CAERE|nr:hypothetical protein GCK72_002150 [Caenorhabditis remanei]EFP03081.1 hypothetical protein CRE_28030 [Caenorhabditis remanei]KAF1770332.1 hypothetical protein GCK72_002150 [Caenorhabditis remanei]
MSSPLGVFGALPTDLLTSLCRHLPMSDVVSLSQLDNEMEKHVKRFIYREIKALRVEINENESTIHFTFKDKRITQLSMRGFIWGEVIESAKCVESLEMIISKGVSTSDLFNALKRAKFSLRSIKIRIPKGGDKLPEKTRDLYSRSLALVQKHSASLRYLEITGSDGQHVFLTMNKAGSSSQMTYNQAERPLPSEAIEHDKNHTFAYSVFHAFLNAHSIKDMTLEIGSKFDAHLALQKAFQLALPYSRRAILERLTIDFGSSLKDIKEQEMKEILLRHVNADHVTIPNLQHFHCYLPHDEIELSQDFLTSLDEPIKKNRKCPTSQPYKSTISPRAVRCQ